MPTNRRRQRGIRVMAAAVLLGLAGLVVAAGIVATTRFGWPVWWLAGSAVAVWFSGVLAARILRNELLASRRDHATERAEQAQAYSELAAARADEHQAFVTAIQKDVDAHLDTISDLKVNLRFARQRAETAERRLKTAAKQREQDAVAIKTAGEETAAARREVALLKSRLAALEATSTSTQRDAEPEVEEVTLPMGAGSRPTAAADDPATAPMQEDARAASDSEVAASLDEELAEAPTVVDLLRWDEQLSSFTESERKHA